MFSIYLCQNRDKINITTKSANFQLWITKTFIDISQYTYSPVALN